jgi:ABC-type multidrug transport system ATPase subunit
MLQSLKKQGITILVSTPYMDEASLCDRVALVQSGRLLSLDTPEGVIQAFGKPLLAVRCSQMYPLLLALPTLEGVADGYAFGEYHHVVVGGDASQVERQLRQLPFPNLEVLPVRPGIEDCFMALMKTNGDNR